MLSRTFVALLHHPDRRTSSATTPFSKSVAANLSKSSYFHDINEAYDILNDEDKRLKYDLQIFGACQRNPNINTEATEYKRMTSKDVNRMFSGLNTFERFTTAQYHAQRSARAPIAIGLRATEFAERKASRAVPLPSKAKSIGWLFFPAFFTVIGAYSIKKMYAQSSRHSKS